MNMENKIEFETFRSVGSYEISNLTKKHPSSINGNVEIHKYRVTIEVIEEPNEVLCERLQYLWDNCDNYHHWTPLHMTAKTLGYTLKGSAGNKLKK
jgi:hypothetical protein